MGPCFQGRKKIQAHSVKADKGALKLMLAKPSLWSLWGPFPSFWCLLLFKFWDAFLNETSLQGWQAKELMHFNGAAVLRN